MRPKKEFKTYKLIIFAPKQKPCYYRYNMDLSSLDYYILGEVVTCILSLILCCNIFVSFSIYDKRHRLFMYGGVSSFIATSFDVFAVICISNYSTVPIAVSTTISTIFFSFLLMIPMVLSNYALDIAASDKDETELFCSINGYIYSLWMVIVLLNIKTGWLFKYDHELGYIRGPLKDLTYIITAYYGVMTIYTVAKNHKNLARRVIIVFSCYPVICFAFVSIQFFNNKVLLTGTSAFSALLFAYLTIQSDLIDYDVITGLLNENKLKRTVNGRKGQSFLYMLSIDNMNLIQANMEVLNLNKMLLDLGNIFTKYFEHDAFIVSSHRFAGICNSMDEVLEKSKKIDDYIIKLNTDLNTILPTPLETYSTAIAFANGEVTYETILEVINNRLAKSKAEGVRSLQLCDDAILVDMERKRYIHKILKRELTLESEQFQVWFQPIYSISEKKFAYMEALSRLKNTEIGDIPPQEFVNVAENRGLIEKLGFVMFEKVCKFISDNKEVVHAVSINFSVYQMTNPHVVQNVLSTIERFGLEPSNIILEITESIFIDNYDLVHENMTKLAQAGVKFYLDDFGTGYSNLANVIGLPFSTIKIDRSLVLMMEENGKGITLFRNLVSTFKDAGLKILVEGVETNNQNSLVEDAGSDYIQGFLYSRPLPPDECIEFLKR